MMIHIDTHSGHWSHARRLPSIRVDLNSVYESGDLALDQAVLARKFRSPEPTRAQAFVGALLPSLQGACTWGDFLPGKETTVASAR